MRSWMIAFFSGWLLFMLSGHWWHQLEMFVSLPTWVVLAPVVGVLLYGLSSKSRYLILSFLAGVVLAWIVLFRIAHPFNPAENGAIVLVEGQMCEGWHEAKDSANVQKLLFCVSSIEPLIQSSSVRFEDVRRVLLSCYYCSNQLKPNQLYQLEIRIKSQRPLQNFNENWVWQKSWSRPWQARGTIRKVVSERELSRDPSLVPQLLKQIRNKAQQTYRGMAHAASMDALIFGSRQGFSSPEWDILKKSGLTHLMVISGLHISMVAGFLFGITSILGKGLKRRNRMVLSVIVSSLGIGFFIGMIDFGIPAVRATLGTLAVVAFLMVRLRWQPSTIYIGVLIICSLLDPMAIFSAGFWLSFAGVALLMTAFGNRRRVSLSRIEGLWKSQVSFFVGLAGLLTIFFGQLPTVAIIANLIAVPFICLLVLPLGLVAVLANLISLSFGAYLFSSMNFMLEVFWEMGSFLTYSPMLDFSAHRFSLGLLMLVPGFASLLHLRFPLVPWLLPLLVIAAFLPEKSKPKGDFFIEMFDVGQGESLLIHQGQHSLLFDAGPMYEGWSAGEEVILPRLRSQQISRLDEVIVSHGDSDHSGGWSDIQNNMEVGRILAGEPDRVPGSQLCLPQNEKLAQLQIEVLWPVSQLHSEQQTNANNRSCVVMVAFQGLKILLTGDIEAAAIRELLDEKQEMLNADVLVLPHHGSKNSFVPEFLTAVSPSVTLVSTGYANSFGHPHKVVRQWLKHRSIPLFDTAIHGAVRIEAIPAEKTENHATWRVVTARPYLDALTFNTKL